jgi:hypothetical protein
VAAEADLRRVTTKARMTHQQLAALITEVGNIAATLRTADPGAAS